MGALNTKSLPYFLDKKTPAIRLKYWPLEFTMLKPQDTAGHRGEGILKAGVCTTLLVR